MNVDSDVPIHGVPPCLAIALRNPISTGQDPFFRFSLIERTEAMGRPRPIAEKRKRADPNVRIRPPLSTARIELAGVSSVATFH
jgi:hypothetical protein